MAEHLFHASKIGLYSLLILITTIQISLCAYETEVFQLLCFEEGGSLYGSKAANLNMIATHFADNIFRKLALIRLEEVSESVLDSIISRKPNGIVIITPKSYQQEEGRSWEAIYKYFFDRSKAPDNIPTLPVNFVYDSAEITEIYQQFFSKKGSGSESEKLFIIKNEEPKQISQLNLDDFYVQIFYLGLIR